MPGVDINYFMKQAKQLTEKIEQRKAALANELVEGRAADGLVVASVSGAQEVKRITIDKRALEGGDVSLLEDLVAAAVNAGLNASRELMQKELEKVSGGVRIPGLT